MSDSNICIVQLFYLLHGNIDHIIIIISLILLLSLYLSVIEITWILIVINNNINWQLILGLKKLMEETASVFWVDLAYRLRGRDTVLLQDFGGWLTSCIVHIIIVIVIDYLAVGPGSAPSDWAVVPGMYGTHLKHDNVSSISFNNLEFWLTHVVGVVWDASITGGSWCSLT